MISWIQNHLIRHGRLVFLTLLAIVIVAFVFTIGNTPGCTSNKSGYTEQMFYGYDLNSQHEMDALSKKVSLSAILRSGRPLQNDQQFQAQLLSRIASLHLADEMSVPAPDKKAITEHIQSMAAFRGPDGQFSNDAYTRFIDNMETNPNLQQDLMVTVLEEDYRIEQVNKVLTGPGYFLPSEALSQVRRNETELKLTIAEIDYNEFEPKTNPKPEELNAYYLNNIQRYEIPERIQASYVQFLTNDYTNVVKPASEADLQLHFNANRARFVAEYKALQTTPDVPGPKAPVDEVTFEDVRDAVAADLAIEQARRQAQQAAQDFALTLYRNNIPKDSEAFRKQLEDANLTLTAITPYSITDTANNRLPKDMLESAFALTEKRYFSDAYALGNGYAIIIYSGRIPPEIPAYEAVVDAVKADYIAEQKKQLFNEEGSRLNAELKERMNTETFMPSAQQNPELQEEVKAGVFASAAEALDLKVTNYDAFKISEAPRAINRAVLEKAQNMEPEELSPMLTIGDKGIFVYLEKKTVPEITEENEEFIQAREFLQRYSSFTCFNSIQNELVAEGLDKKDPAN